MMIFHPHKPSHLFLLGLVVVDLPVTVAVVVVGFWFRLRAYLRRGQCMAQRASVVVSALAAPAHLDRLQVASFA